MDRSRKALETIALGYSQGIVSVDILIKACDKYKIQKGLIDDLDYSCMVSKSLFDQLNGVKQDKEIAKAIVPGQTKYVDGVLYIYSATKQGSKTDYGWHVARKSKVGKSSKLDDKAAKASADAVNSLFPTDVSSVSVVKAAGGSTGAQLVKDVNGNEYIMKKATKVSAEHVRSEYISNMLYNILGLKTPDFELYNADSDTDITMLSKFIPGTRKPNSGDFAAMGHGFIADILLANWDVYMNDNCRIDAGGNVIRVDNGACLFYRAQGGIKNPPFDENVMRTYKDMLKYNSLLAKCLIPKDLIQQIDAVTSKKDDIVNFLKESGQDKVADILGKRIDNLKKIKDEIEKEERRQSNLAAAKAGKIPPRKLVPAKDMYAEIEDDDLQAMLDEVANSVGSKRSALTDYHHSDTGWTLLSKICQERGFDGRPRVVTEDEFWKEAASAKLPMMLRGNHKKNGLTGAEYADLFRYDDKCYYGEQGVWGQGIYAHTDDTNQKWLDDLQAANKAKGSYVDRNTIPYDAKDDKNNHSNATNYKSSNAYKHAHSYSDFEDAGVLKILWEPDANVVNLDDLLKEIQNNPPQFTSKNKKVILKLKAELDDLKKQWMDAELSLMNYADVIKKDVYKKMHYDEVAIEEMYDKIDNTSWGNRTANNLPDYPKFDDFVLTKMVDWVTKNGGKAEVGENKSYVNFTIGGETLTIARYSWENNAIKRKNSLIQPYNFHAERFKTLMETHCIRRVETAVKKAVDNSTDAVKKMKDDVQAISKSWYDKKSEYDKEVAAASTDESLYGLIYDSVKDIGPRNSGDNISVVGIYAAMKGYDGIYVHNGNTENHGFNVILNRTKCITSME